jgi:hypothetical protein
MNDVLIQKGFIMHLLPDRLFFKAVSTVILSSALYSCGGGSDTENTDSSQPPTVPVSLQNNGGTVSNPSAVSYSKQNVLSDSFNNYFSIELNEKSDVYISLILDDGLTSSDRSSCAIRSVNGFSGFVNLNGNNRGCGHKVFIQIEAGAHELHFDIPLDGAGYFTIDSYVKGQQVTLPANGTGGRASAPKLFSIGEQNQINKDMLFNFYAYEGNAGDRIVINTYLNNTIDSRMFSLCNIMAANNRALQNVQRPIILENMIGVSVNGGIHNCSDALDYSLPEDGIYIFHIMYSTPQSITFPIDGYFLVDVQS